MTEILNSVLFFTAIPIYVLGFIGNVLVIWIVRRTHAMHTTTNYLLVNLAIADVITILLRPLYSSSRHIDDQYLSNGVGKFVCKLTAFIEISIMASSFTLTVLAVERYYALMEPFRTRYRLNTDNIKQAIALIWILSFLICLPAFIFLEWKESLATCVGPWTLHMNKQSKVYFVVNSVFSTYVPMTVMTYCYGSLIRGLYFTNTICAEPVTADESSSEKKKLVITCILATAGLFVCFVPSVVFYTFVVPNPDEQADLELYSDLSAVFAFLFICSLCFNPMLYAFRSTNFQDGFKRILCCCGPVSQNHNI